MHPPRLRISSTISLSVVGRAIALLFAAALAWASEARAAELLAGVAKVDITDHEAGPVNDPLYVKALVLKYGTDTVAIITVDAVAIGEIGRIKNTYLTDVRSQLAGELQIKPSHVLVNASHCHGVVCTDVERRTVEAVKAAAKELVPVRVGVGVGHEDRIMENRRLILKDGREADVRRAYSLPRDEDVAAVGPIDPQIGLLRLDRADGRTLAVVYNFACHPIQGVPNGGNTADYPAFASRVIEEHYGHGALALFVQGCGGDINPINYKDVHHRQDAEPLGNLLGLSVVRALNQVKSHEIDRFQVVNEMLSLPRGADLESRMASIEAETARLVKSLKGTSLNFKTFMPLYVQYKLNADFPTTHSHRYLQDKSLARDDLAKLDAQNRADLEAYVRNIHTMEEISKLQTNLALLKKHHAQNVAAGTNTIDVEIAGLRIGEFRLVTFPGELTAEIGLNIKKRAGAPYTFVAGYTNGYIYYAPTEKQRRNAGYAQEDCDSLVGPAWQPLFEDRVAQILKKL